jgi:N-acetylmuramoyl-L-alanine amidase
MRRKRPRRTLGGLVLASVPIVALAVVAYFALAGRKDEPQATLVVVESGDTLSAIGRRTGVAPETIASLNHIADPSRLYPGQVLLVPTSPEARLPRTLEQRVAEITRVPADAPRREWRYIVVHHSAFPTGSAQTLHDYHLHVRRWSNGLGYHFVIGNGTGTPDGFIEAGPRWARQLQGAHAKSPNNEMNEIGIGICLVGNFNETAPSEAQMRALVALVRRLQRRYGIPSRRVIGHRDVVEGHTECPGHNFSIERLREML